MLKKLKNLDIKSIVFLTIFLLASVYILFVKSKLYEASTNVVVKDLSTQQQATSGLSMLLTGTGNSSLQTVLTLQKYLESYDVLEKLDAKFALKKHYQSDDLDFIQRLYSWSNKEAFLELYRSRLQIEIDEQTSILTLRFLHTDPKIAFEIVKDLVKDADLQINEYNKITARKQLHFVGEQVLKSKNILDKSIKKLEDFQKKYMMLDPSKTAQAQFGLVANVEATLLEKKAKLNELMQYMNEDNFEIVRVKSEIKELSKMLQEMKHSLASSNDNSLNVYIFEFEYLKSMTELNKELYKQSLLQLEQVKAQVNKNSKMLLVLTQPYMPDGYKYPERLKDFVTLLLILGLLYGIVSLLGAIIKEHRD